MGSPSRNVQYHPPRLSEDRLNLPQPHSPSLPTHCSGKSGMRPFQTGGGCSRTPARVLDLDARWVDRESIEPGIGGQAKRHQRNDDALFREHPPEERDGSAHAPSGASRPSLSSSRSRRPRNCARLIDVPSTPTRGGSPHPASAFGIVTRRLSGGKGLFGLSAAGRVRDQPALAGRSADGHRRGDGRAAQPVVADRAVSPHAVSMTAAMLFGQCRLSR